MRTGHRTTLRRGITLALVASVVAFAIPALSAGTSGASARPRAAASGTLDWYGAGLPANGWDPILSSAGHEIFDLALVYDGLTELNAQGQVEPSLATSWVTAPNKLAITFYLRQHQQFSDGTPINAAAVVENIKRDIDTADSTLATFLTTVSSVQAVGEYAVKFNLNQRDPGLAAILAGKAGLVVSPAALANPSSLSTKPVGAGPFILTQYVPNGYAEFVRNPHYWDAKDIHIQNLYLSAATSSTSAGAASVLSALESHQANFAVITPTQIQAAHAAGFATKVFRTLTVDLLQIKSSSFPYNNQKVVEAIGYALNRPALVSVLEDGYGVADDEPFPPNYPGYDKSPAVADYYTYNPTKASKLLAEAGYPNGTGLPTLTLSTASAPPESEQIQAELQAVGIKTSISTIPSTATTQLGWYQDELTMFTEGIVGRESASELLDLVWAKNGVANPGRQASSQLSRALAEFTNTPQNGANYTTFLDQTLKLGVQQSANLWLFAPDSIFAYSKSVQGFVPDIDFQTLNGISISS